MPRAARIVIAGQPHHVTQRGNHRAAVFFSDEDRQDYLRILLECARRQRVSIIAYCLMPNHVHFIVVPEEKRGLHRTFGPLHMRYAQRINRRRNLNGHLWQARFFSTPLDDGHFQAAVRYVECNPVRAGLVTLAQDYDWSSARARCAGTYDPVLLGCGKFQAPFEEPADWSGWLAEAEDPQQLEHIRRSTGYGSPCFTEASSRKGSMRDSSLAEGTVPIERFSTPRE